jgi:hypothetical protein
MSTFSVFTTSTTATGARELNGMSNFVAGGTARSFVGFVLMPFTVVKVRYEVGIAQRRDVGAFA